MNDAPGRRFTVLDAIALVAATAIGIAIVRSNFDDVADWFARPSEGWTVAHLLRAIPPAMIVLIPCFLSWTAALLVLRFRKPRPHMRSIFMQPGTSACMAVLCGAIFNCLKLGTLLAVEFLLSSFSVPRSLGVTDYSDTYGMLIRGILRVESAGPNMPDPAALVLLVWTLLVLSGQWHRENTWVDRAGRRLGVVWIFVGACVWWFQFVEPSLPYDKAAVMGH